MMVMMVVATVKHLSDLVWKLYCMLSCLILIKGVEP